MSRPVLHAPRVLLGGEECSLEDASGQQGRLTVVGAEARHGRGAKRLRAGESVDLVDGAGVRVLARVSPEQDSDPASLAVDVEDVVVEGVSGPQMVLVQALAKGGRDESAVEAATELGVQQVVPWQAERSVVRWVGKKAAAGPIRWGRVVLAAAKQARRAWVPEVSPAADTTQLAGLVERAVGAGGLAILCHEEAEESIVGVLERAVGVRGKQESVLTEVMIIVGPEGGVAPGELAALQSAGAHPVRLGPTVLRSSTAGPAALVAANVILGKW